MSLAYINVNSQSLRKVVILLFKRHKTISIIEGMHQA